MPCNSKKQCIPWPIKINISHFKQKVTTAAVQGVFLHIPLIGKATRKLLIRSSATHPLGSFLILAPTLSNCATFAGLPTFTKGLVWFLRAYETENLNS